MLHQHFISLHDSSFPNLFNQSRNWLWLAWSLYEVLWSAEASLHIYKRLYLWNIWCKYEVLGCLALFSFHKLSKKVFTLHAQIIFHWSITCYWREEFAQLFTSLHASSHLVTLWFRLSQTKNSILGREGLWRLVKTWDRSSHW